MIRLRRSLGSVESRRRMIAFGETTVPIRTVRRARAIRDGLRDLYSMIKDSDAHIRFAFLTGVRKTRALAIMRMLDGKTPIPPIPP
jgi:hypothetical protein